MTKRSHESCNRQFNFFHKSLLFFSELNFLKIIFEEYHHWVQTVCKLFSIYLMETPFDNFANRLDPDQAALTRAAKSGSALFGHGNMIIYDPALVDLTCNVFVLCTNVKVNLYNYS